MSAATKPGNLSQAKERQLDGYRKQVKENINALTDNFIEIVKCARVEDEAQISKTAQSEQEMLEMNIRATNMVRAAEALVSVVNDMKLFTVLNDVDSINSSVATLSTEAEKSRTRQDEMLRKLRDDMAADLYELEEEYGSSAYK